MSWLGPALRYSALKIAIGTRFYPAQPESARRQLRAQQAIRALADVCPINLQFADEGFAADGFEMRPVLRHDSRTVTGGAGLRKPIVSEMFDALADAAQTHGCRYFVYLNADIEVTAAALDYVRAGGLDGCAFCRVDLEPVTRTEAGIERYGLDMYAIDTAWWARERHRFRPYIAGEACWDNVYAALLCAHGRADIVDREALIFHERHDASWGSGIFGHYNGYLAALDAAYFSQWTHFVARRQAASDPSGRQAVIADVFGPPSRSPFAYAWQAGRSVRARWRYAAHARQARRAVEAGG
jgi:hypothetical protein